MFNRITQTNSCNDAHVWYNMRYSIFIILWGSESFESITYIIIFLILIIKCIKFMICSCFIIINSIRLLQQTSSDFFPTQRDLYEFPCLYRYLLQVYHSCYIFSVQYCFPNSWRGAHWSVSYFFTYLLQEILLWVYGTQGR